MEAVITGLFVAIVGQLVATIVASTMLGKAPAIRAMLSKIARWLKERLRKLRSKLKRKKNCE